MNDNKTGTTKTRAALTAVLLLAAVFAALICNIIILTTAGLKPFFKLAAVINLFACGCALYYMVNGFKKASARWYRCYILLFAWVVLTASVSAAANAAGALASVISCLQTLVFACLFVLLFGRDLGVRLSMTICKAVIVIEGILFIYTFFRFPTTLRGGDPINNVVVIRTGSLLLYAIILAVMTHAKYLDKASRGTK